MLFNFRVMKKNIHPAMHPVVFRDTSVGVDFPLWSTLTSNEKEKINGVERFVIHMEVSSASHPFFTGKQKFLDTSGRVEKFQKKMEMVQSKKSSK